MEYIVYKITNTANNKIYIGKTKEHYGKMKFGITGRLKHHICSALSKSKCNDCPRLYNAIRKYGKEAFVIDEIEHTTSDNVDAREIYNICHYKSTDRKIGYNIALGGGGRSVVNVTEETRDKISKAQDPDGIPNIKPYYKNDIHVGYYARRRHNGKVYSKYFTSVKKTLGTNLENATNWLNDIKNNKFDTLLKYNRTCNLPMNIYSVRDKKDKNLIIGYTVMIKINDVKYVKSFQSKTTKLDILLKKAVEYKNSLLDAK
jgi:hypothetical protein